jgi:hypothetical protein
VIEYTYDNKYYKIELEIALWNDYAFLTYWFLKLFLIDNVEKIIEFQISEGIFKKETSTEFG